MSSAFEQFHPAQPDSDKIPFSAYPPRDVSSESANFDYGNIDGQTAYENDESGSPEIANHKPVMIADDDKDYIDIPFNEEYESFDEDSKSHIQQESMPNNDPIALDEKTTHRPVGSVGTAQNFYFFNEFISKTSLGRHLQNKYKSKLGLAKFPPDMQSSQTGSISPFENLIKFSPSSKISDSSKDDQQMYLSLHLHLHVNEKELAENNTKSLPVKRWAFPSNQNTSKSIPSYIYSQKHVYPLKNDSIARYKRNNLTAILPKKMTTNLKSNSAEFFQNESIAHSKGNNLTEMFPQKMADELKSNSVESLQNSNSLLDLILSYFKLVKPLIPQFLFKPPSTSFNIHFDKHFKVESSGSDSDQDMTEIVTTKDGEDLITGKGFNLLSDIFKNLSLPEKAMSNLSDARIWSKVHDFALKKSNWGHYANETTKSIKVP